MFNYILSLSLSLIYIIKYFDFFSKPTSLILIKFVEKCRTTFSTKQIVS